MQQMQQTMPGMAQPMATPAPPSQQPMMTAAPVAPPAAGAGPIIVPGFTVSGLTVEFECTKPDIWNKQVSVLVAKCKNAAPDAVHGFNLQCAVPKYITMEMEPPSSTTIPVTGGTNSKPVTQKIKVTNSMLGTKNLMLKLKVSFTLQGNKVEQMVTCSAFPAGEY
jgi:AP-1 complex subunit gamma-1